VKQKLNYYALLFPFFKKVGFNSKDIAIKVNSRSLLASLLSSIGVPTDQFSAICILVDKLEKVPLESLKSEFHNLGVNDDMLSTMVDVLKIGNLQTLKIQLQKTNPLFLNFEDKSENKSDKVQQLEEEFKQLETLFAYATKAGIADWLILDTSMVRGLSYYTGIVFEAFDRKGKFRSICGGGRYDNLLSTMGSDTPVRACGFGFGDVVVMELLASYNKLPNFEDAGSQECDIVVSALDVMRQTRRVDSENDNAKEVDSENMHGEAIQVAEMLREQGLSVDLVLGPKKMKWILKHALKKKSPFLALIGPDEWNSSQGHSIVIKDLKIESQIVVPIKSIPQWAESQSHEK